MSRFEALIVTMTLGIAAGLVTAAVTDGIFYDGFEGQCVTDCPPPPLTYCEQIAADPLVQPAGRQGVIRTWSQAFYDAPFYTPTSYLHPIGSITMGELPQPGRWLSIAFTPEDNARYSVVWAEAQSVFYPVRYNGRPATDVYVTVSPCPGDFRLENNSSQDGYAKRGCRRGGQSNSITFGTHVPNSSTATCALQVGITHYLNIGFFTAGETDPMAHTCHVGTRCEINAKPL